jgi:uncharacterized protein YaaR (DUF327 family)
MQHDKIANVLVKQIDDKVLQLQEALSDGRVETLDEYKKVCGEVRGLLTARNYITDLNKVMENSDE